MGLWGYVDRKRPVEACYISALHEACSLGDTWSGANSSRFSAARRRVVAHDECAAAGAPGGRLSKQRFVRDFAESGGVVSYGTDFADRFRHVGIYVGKILQGATPADLPIMQPTNFALTINLKTAKALGVTMPPNLIDRADEVIE